MEFDRSAWTERLAKWACAWNLEGLEERVRWTLSSRMRSSLGRYVPRRREIRIACFVVDAPTELLEEVVCHEFAHAAVDEAFGRGCRPHGVEWRRLMLRAGRDPRVRLPATELAGLLPSAGRFRRFWRHRCPVCLAERLAGRPVKTWRCARCISRGLAGRIEIHRIDRAEDADDSLSR